MSFLETCRQLIGLDSTPSRGTREVGEFLATRCKEAGLHVELDQESLGGIEQVNLVARLQAEPRDDELMLQTHLDTVDPGHFAAWTKTQANPFAASIYGDQLYGLGAADTKLDFLCKLEAIRSLKDKAWRKPFVLVGTYGAQSGMAGAVKLMRKKRVRAKLALVGEPTQLQLATGGLGLAIVEITVPFSREEFEYRQRHDSLESGSTQSKIFVGKSAHGSDPALGENAIIKMLDYLAKLPSGIAIMDLDGGTSYNTVPAAAVLEIDVVGSIREPILTKIAAITRALVEMEDKLRQIPAPGFVPPYPTVNLGTIRTLTDHVCLTGSCRLPPSVSESVYEEWMGAMQRTCADLGAVFTVKDYKAAFATVANSAVVRAGQGVKTAMGGSGELIQIPTSTEANVFSRFGMECLVVGPGQGVGNSHAPNESIRLSELHQASEFYRRLLEDLCL